MPTFKEAEESVDQGRPIEFYEFRMPSNGINWLYVSGDRPEEADDHTWLPAAISAANIQQTGEYINDALRIECPSWIGPAQLFMTAAPSYPVQLIISCRHEGSTERLVAWQGEVKQVNFPMPGRAVLTCESLSSTFRREGLRLAWQRSCPYMLYDPITCRLNKDEWAVNFTVLAINGFHVELALEDSKDNGYFNGGYIEWNHPTRGKEFLFVEESAEVSGEANGLVKLFGFPGELFEGATGKIYPGCDFTPTKCQSFNNYDNYGGHPDLPGKSPFDGTPVF